MPIPVVCPSCSARTKAPERFAGGFMSCPKCEEPIPVPEADRDAITERAPSKPKKGAIARPKRDDDDLPTPPDVAHKGIKVLIAGGIVAVVALVLATIVLLKGMWKEKPAAEPPVAAATPEPKKEEPGKPFAPAKDAVYHDATKGPVRVGDIDVRVTRARWGKVTLLDLVSVEGSGEKPSDNNALVVDVEIRNLSPTMRVVYTGWSAPDAQGALEMLGQAASGQGAAPTMAALKDDAGGPALAQVKFGGLVKVKDQKRREPILPKRSVTDVLVFEEPAAGAGALLLDLPMKALGGSDYVRFRIPKTAVLHDKK